MLTENLSQLKEDLARLSQQKTQELGQEYQDLEKEESALSKEKVAAESDLKYQTKMTSEEEAQLATLQKNLGEMQEAMIRTKEGQETAVADFDALTQELQHLQQQVVSLGQRMEAAEAGVATGAGESNGSLTDQLMEAKKVQSQAKTSAKQISMQIKANKKEFSAKSDQVSKDGAKFEQVNKQTNALLKEKENIQARLSKLTFDPVKQKALVAEREQLKLSIRELSQKIDALAPQTQGGLNYNYNRPQKAGFDASMVHGRVGKLINVKDAEACTALEVVAGSKVRNVVVDSAETGKELLKTNGKQRTTFIPLDKIRSDPLVDKAKRAQELVGAENADLAVNYVQFDPAVTPAMNYVFGRSIVCTENIHAKQIAFSSDPKVVAHCVTFDGDVFDPSGTLTGGSKGSMGQTLKVMNTMQGLEQELSAARSRLREVETELQGLEAKAQEYAKISRDLQLKEHELSLLQEKMKSSSSHQIVMRVAELKAELEKDEELLAKATAEEKTASARVKELESLIKDFAKTKDQQIKEMKKEMTANKKKQATIKSKLGSARDAKDTLVAEFAALEEEKAATEAQMDISSRTLSQLEEAKKEASDLLEKVRVRFDAATEALAVKKNLLAKCDKELSHVAARQNKAQESLAQNELKAKELERRVQQFNKSTASARSTIERMQAEHEWIEPESQFFGKPQTDYDFSVNNPKRAEEELTALMKEQQKLEGTINKKVASMISEADRKYKDLQGRKSIVERDKAQILATIAELDQKKVEALEKTYDAVNESFGKLYSKFLPGATAVLTKVNNNILDGLDIRVQFGKVWKESLTELSGGQRSLMALSLILALCRYKAAPLYILDEIDAALDNSHTENIGDIIGQEFSSSQFIVVSLKEGFYRNCNTLFQVELDESIQSSKVTRTARKKPNPNLSAKKRK
jgi:structural maintenance of chromosome 2